jgi:hypothetical protein
MEMFRLQCASGFIAQAALASKRFLQSLFRHLPKRLFTTYRRGPGEAAECEASAEGWRERPVLTLFGFSLGTRSPRRYCSSDSGPPSSPPAPRLFHWLTVMLVAAGRQTHSAAPIRQSSPGVDGHGWPGTGFPARESGSALWPSAAIYGLTTREHRHGLPATGPPERLDHGAGLGRLTLNVQAVGYPALGEPVDGLLDRLLARRH